MDEFFTIRSKSVWYFLKDQVMLILKTANGKYYIAANWIQHSIV